MGSGPSRDDTSVVIPSDSTDVVCLHFGVRNSSSLVEALLILKVTVG